MLLVPDRTTALSQLVLQLHRGCRSWPAETFHDRACELLAEVLPFQSAFWGREYPDTGLSVTLQGYQVSDALLSDLLSGGAAADPLLQRARAQPGTAVSLRWDGTDHATSPASHHRLACGLAAVQNEPLTRLRSFICLWRAVGEPCFDAADLQVLQFLLPHLLETARESQLLRSDAGMDAAANARGHAVCTAAGELLHVDDRCHALLRLEWPQGPAGALPAALQTALRQAMQPGAPPVVHSGRHVTLRLSGQGASVLVTARLRGAIDRLSNRQRAVAELYAEGCTGAEIAQRLGLAPSTVNNHLGEIFKKLQVSSKLQLAKALQGSAA